MPDKMPAQPGRPAPYQDMSNRSGAENAGAVSGSWSLIAKIGTATFATIIAPLLVGLILKLLESPAPPAAQPAVAQVEPKPVGAVAVPVASSPSPTEKAPMAAAVSSPPPERPPAVVAKHDLAPKITSSPKKGKKKANVADAPERVAARLTPLFNGRDLTGWTEGDRRWSVDVPKQLLVGHAVGLTKGHGWLYTERRFSDFRLRLEYRARPQSDSGIALRVFPGAKLEERFEIQLLGDQDHVITTGTIIGLRLDANHPNTRPATPVSLRKAGEWNLVEVEFRGPRLRLTFNGQAVQDVRFDEHPDSKNGTRVMGDSGGIGLQCRTGHVEFRNIEIQELTRAAVRPRR
jgi:Domain of Unknown Function (DUF1080)